MTPNEEILALREALEKAETDVCKMVEQFTRSQMTGPAATLTYIADNIRQALTDTAEAGKQARESVIQEAIQAFVRSILHGDYEHQNWLIEEGERFVEALKGGE